MAEKIRLVRGDALNQVRVTLTDDSSGNAIDLVDAVVRLKFRQVGATTLADTITGTVFDPANGIVIFAMTETSLSGPAGDYEAEIEVTFPGSGGVQTVYDILKFYIREQF